MAALKMSLDQAETLALQALGWLVGEDELLPLMMGATGASIDDLRTAAGDRVFLASLLEFLGNDDRWIKRFCDDFALPYEAPMMAHAILAGPSMTHWT